MNIKVNYYSTYDENGSDKYANDDKKLPLMP